MKTYLGIAHKPHLTALLFAGFIGLLATGCQTYKSENHIIQYWQQGNLTNAVAEATKKAANNLDNKDTIVWRLEQGTVLRANGQYEESIKAFDAAEEKINRYAEAAKVKVGHEAGALLSNQAELPYEGRAYDGIMLNTYKALNYLQLGEFEKARPELFRAYQRQRDAVEDNQRRIEKIQEEAAKSKDKAAMEKAANDPRFQAQMQGTNYASLNDLKAYADYVNPFTVYLDGLYFMANAADMSDLEHAHKSFERVGGFLGDNAFIKQDLAAVDSLIHGQPLPPTTYVIFETGCAPLRDQIRIDVPIIVTRVSYVGAAFPTLRFQGNYIPSLSVTVDGTHPVSTALLASMDSVIGQDFKNEMPIVTTKTIAATVTKAIAAYAINEAANQQSAMAGLFAQLATAAYQMAVNIADTRTWTTLPKEFQFCRLPTPADRKLEIATADGLQKTTVTVGDGLINIVYVKSINPLTPLLVSQIKLNGASDVKQLAVSSTNSTAGAAYDYGASAAPAPATVAAAVPQTPEPPATVTNSAAAPDLTTNVAPESHATNVVAAVEPPPQVAPAAAAVAAVPSVAPVEAQTIDSPEVDQLCLSLKSSRPNEVIQALKKLRRLNAPQAVPQILPCLNARLHPNVIRDACRTLAVLGRKDIVPQIEPLLADKRADVRKDAQNAIFILQMKP